MDTGFRRDNSGRSLSTQIVSATPHDRKIKSLIRQTTAARGHAAFCQQAATSFRHCTAISNSQSQHELIRARNKKEVADDPVHSE
jgi:hypothetical protein